MQVMKNLLRPFGSDAIHRDVNYVYEIYKLSLIFSIACLPWILVNMLVKLDIATCWLYGLAFLILYPNLKVLFNEMININKNQVNVRGKSYFIKFITELKHYAVHNVLYGLLVSTAGIVYFIEFKLIVAQKELRFMIIPFLIIGAFLLTSVITMMFVVDDTLTLKERLRVAMFLSWRNVVRTFAIALLFMLWLSVGYNSPFLNILIGNALLLWLIYKLRFKSVQRTLKQLNS
ncbi:hypothetical protein [Lapidilactobacillus bayanensis]|uniref:hypothetical protein n=1 Tax=Lapidilactobacillus bayanensis TaxID=2485998 RepID=UPI0013DDD303|nr:hypothetical protein [Lapidilactobacillus bayanensis]